MKTVFKSLMVCGLALSSALVFAETAPAQATGGNEKATAILKNIHKLDVLNQILPVLMTKEQLNKILLEVEKVRAASKEVEAAELKELEAVQAKVDKAVDDCFKSGDIPPEELMDELAKLNREFVARRRDRMTLNSVQVYQAMKASLNEGQIKAAANSLNPKIFNPDAKVDEMSDEQKLTLWIRYVLLDPVAYEVLVELAKK